MESFCTLFPGRRPAHARLRARSSLIKSMNDRGSLLNDLPAIERIYRYCLLLLNHLTCETTVSSSPRLQSEARATRRKNISNFAS